MLALCLDVALAQDYDAQTTIENFTKDKLSFNYKFPSGVPDMAEFHLVPSATYANLDEVVAATLGKKLLTSVPSAAETEFQANTLTPDDVDDIDYNTNYDFCVLADTDDDGVLDEFVCFDVMEPLAWGSYTTDELKEGTTEFELNYDIAVEEDTENGGPLYYAVYKEDKDPTADEVIAGTDSIVKGNGVITITPGDQSGTQKVEILDDEELYYHQYIYISTVLQTGASEQSDVITERFRVQEHDWGWKIGEILGVAFGVIFFVAAIVGLIFMFGPGGTCAICACCAAASLVD